MTIREANNMPSQTEEIKARIDVVDLLSEYIQLKQAGTNWKGLCPFHNEKTPSFMASKEKQIWHCFGCSEGGDIFSFVQKIEGLEFPEALRLLAKKAGVKVEYQDPKLASQRNRLLDVCQLATKFWHKVLLDSPAGQKARDYLKKRQVTQEVIEEFKLGYGPDSWDTLIKFLKSKGFTDNEIFLAGLVVKKDRGQGFYDRFRDRLMFPINDTHGNVVGFTGRTLSSEEKGGKYINTPQTLVYNKSLILYNLDQAKVEIKKQDLAIVVEGQMDVVASTQAGVSNVVAISGTAFTLDQLKILKRYTSNIAIAFDTDLAGQSASQRGIDLALSQEINVKIITLPQGKDPDDCIKENPSDWIKAIKEAKSIMEYYFDQAQSQSDLTQVEGKKAAAKMLLPIIAKIGNKIEQTHWLQKLGELLEVSEQILRESLPSANKESSHQSTKVEETEGKKSGNVKNKATMLSERILAILLKLPDFLPTIINDLEPELISGDQLRNLYKELIIYYTKDINGSISDFDSSQFQAKIKPVNLNQLVDTLDLLAEKDFFDLDKEVVQVELTKTINLLKRDYFSTQLTELESKIKKAEKNQEIKDIEILSNQFSQIIKQLNLLN